MYCAVDGTEALVGEVNTKIIFCDITKCDNCKACVTACESEHYGRNHMFIQPVGDFFIPSNCRQCEGSPCVEVCPTGACHRSGDGPVSIAPMKCVGCRLCAIACPFGAIWFDSLNKISRKCDLCKERLTEGLEPACVAACSPQHALKFVTLDEALEMARSRSLEAVMTRASGNHGTLLSIPEKWNGKGG